MVGRIEYELAGADLGEVRFALSPMNELALSLRTTSEPLLGEIRAEEASGEPSPHHVSTREWLDGRA